MVRSRVRAGFAWLTIFGLGLVICAPIWHGAHHSLTSTVAEGPDHQQPDIHLCGTGGHTTHHIRCPICLSQRLLNQTDTGTTPLLATPSPGKGPELAPADPITITVSHAAQPRAPPRA